MSPINRIEDEQDLSHHNNFFREDPEKSLSKHMRGMTQQDLARASKHLLEQDKGLHKQNNLKLVERQKRKAQAARRQQAAEKQKVSK